LRFTSFARAAEQSQVMSQSHATATPAIRPGHLRNFASSWFILLCSLQGFYFLITGVWPLVSIETFQAVTGQKTDHLVTGRESDHWLVNTVGVLVTANSLVLLLAAWRGRPTPEVVLLGIASAVGLIAIDVIYVSREVLAPVYLADAAIELLFVAGWIWVAMRMAMTEPGPVEAKYE
jgi:hypothetical protein